MGSGVTDYGTDAWTQALFGLGTVPASYYLALTSDEPGPGIDGVTLADLEPSGGGYARQLYGTGASYWEPAGAGITNLLDIAFPLPSADWGTLTSFALCDSLTGGEVFAWGPLTSPVYISTGWLLTISAGSLALTLTSLDPSIELS